MPPWAGSTPDHSPVVAWLEAGGAYEWSDGEWGGSVGHERDLAQMSEAIDNLLAKRRPVDPTTHVVGLGQARMKDRRAPRQLIDPVTWEEVERSKAALGVEVYVEDVVGSDGALHTRIRVVMARGQASVLVDECAREGSHWGDVWDRAFRELGLIA